MRVALSRAVAMTAIALLSVVPPAAAADPVADFFSGKRIRMYVGSTPGGGYDAYARHVARHIRKYIPGNPEFVVQNMPGGGGMRVTNYLYNVAEKDGTAMATVQRGLLVTPLLETRNTDIKFEPRKFNWIGSLNTETGLIVAWHTTPHRTFKDLMDKELLVGSSSPSTDFMPQFLNNVLGTKMKIIAGYQSSTEAYLAMERGEVTGRVSTGWAGDREILEPWMKADKVRFLVQLSLTRHAEFPNLPSVMEFARNDREKRILDLILSSQLWGRPFVMPPGVPAVRVAAVRKAFTAMLKDTEFLAEAKQLRLDLEIVTAEEIDKILARIYALPPDVIEDARRALAQ